MNPTKAVIDNPNAAAPQKVAAKLKDAAVTGSKNIKSFKSDYQSEEMKNLWQKVNSSEFPQGEDVWTRDYTELAGGWKVEQTDVVKTETDERQGDEFMESNDTEAVKKFQEQNPTFPAKSSEESRTLPFELTIDGTTYVIERSGAGEAKELRVTLKSDAVANQRDKGILKHIQHEHASETIGSMLSLVSSYKDVKSTPCQKCSKVFDPDLQFALIRKRKGGSTDNTSPIWIPLHQSCIS